MFDVLQESISLILFRILDEFDYYKECSKDDEWKIYYDDSGVNVSFETFQSDGVKCDKHYMLTEVYHGLDSLWP